MMALAWTHKDDVLARQYGWTLATTGDYGGLHNSWRHHGWRIMRADDRPDGRMWFASDATHDLVRELALAGDKQAIKAFMVMDRADRERVFGALGMLALAAEYAPELLRE